MIHEIEFQSISILACRFPVKLQDRVKKYLGIVETMRVLGRAVGHPKRIPRRAEEMGFPSRPTWYTIFSTVPPVVSKLLPKT